MFSVPSLYIHAPFCLTRCNYCDFYKSVPDPSQLTKEVEHYFHYLHQSMEVLQKILKQNDYQWAPLQTVYWGGGTPSLLGAQGASAFFQFFEKWNLSFDQDYEFTLEINPGTFNDAEIKRWQEVGVNRFSLGVQTLNDELLMLLNRSHTSRDAIEGIEYLSSQKLNFSIDLMFGLPKSIELERDILDELHFLDKYKISHYSIYELTVGESYIYADLLPNEVFRENEFDQISKFLTSRDYQHYEVSNFSKRGFESRHNLKYWEAAAVAALGPSGTGFLPKQKNFSGGLRFKWASQMSDTAHTVENLGPEALQMEQIYLGMRSKVGVQEAQLGPKVFDLFKTYLGKQGLLVDACEEGIIRLNSKGYKVLDHLMSQLFSLQKENRPTLDV